MANLRAVARAHARARARSRAQKLVDGGKGGESMRALAAKQWWSLVRRRSRARLVRRFTRLARIGARRKRKQTNALALSRVARPRQPRARWPCAAAARSRGKRVTAHRPTPRRRCVRRKKKCRPRRQLLARLDERRSA